MALIAFAGNSVLCRLALGEAVVDAGSFTSIRLVSGACVLGLLLQLSQRYSRRRHQLSQEISNAEPSESHRGSWRAAILLFVYAVGFSYAYISLDTGTGALILFASVQITMILSGMIQGHKLHITEQLGVLVSILGFIYLMLPGAAMPAIPGFILMSIAGVAWGFYSLLGRGSGHPLADTAYNFIRCIPLVMMLAAVTLFDAYLSLEGIILAILSGAVTSGVGYTIWYMALRGLSAVQAAVVQLFVPVIAAFGGVIFAQEVLSMRLVTASLLILGGIFIVILGRQYWSKPTAA
ncbi:DMT family transporter [Alteromonas sp. a30]|nr:DMT family transporter [Alteromonas sp. a30]